MPRSDEEEYPYLRTCSQHLNINSRAASTFLFGLEVPTRITETFGGLEVQGGGRAAPHACFGNLLHQRARTMNAYIMMFDNGVW